MFNNVSQVGYTLVLHGHMVYIRKYVFCPLRKLSTEFHALKEIVDQVMSSQQQLMNSCIANQMSVLN